MPASQEKPTFPIYTSPVSYTHLEKCDTIVEALGNPNIKTAKVDADNVDELVALFNNFKPEMVINVALPLSLIHI